MALTTTTSSLSAWLEVVRVLLRPVAFVFRLQRLGDGGAAVVEEGEDGEDASVVFFVCADAELGEDARDVGLDCA